MRYNKNKNERETNNKHTFICLKSSKREQLKKRKKKEYNKKKQFVESNTNYTKNVNQT